VVVLGMGNVAVDCARMLLQPPGRLAATDVARHAHAQLAASAVRSVDLVGRRGPVQARAAPRSLPTRAASWGRPARTWAAKACKPKPYPRPSRRRSRPRSCAKCSA